MLKRLIVAFAALLFGCQGSEPASSGNPFLEDQSGEGKADTQYYNPGGIEVEVDIEADVDASAYQKDDAPAMLGQFALTYLRKRGHFYLESIAEDSTSSNRVEWRIDGTWKTAAEVSDLPSDQLTHFRIRGMNAVLLASKVEGAAEGQTFVAIVPKKPYSVYTDAGKTCADEDSHLGLDASIYWYMWNPDKAECAIQTQEMTVTLTKLLPPRRATYPEYDRLTEDGKVTAVLLIGRVGDEVTPDDWGVRIASTFCDWLLEADYREVTPAPVGRRFEKDVGPVLLQIDVYSPFEFHGLSDYGHFDNLQKAISEHEIVSYSGHSMLGASDFWGRPTYPDFYQIFLYGGCLGYQYYVKPILDGKRGWDNLDLVSSVLEVPVQSDNYTAPFLAKLEWALGHGNAATWRDLMITFSKHFDDASFGVSGVRENCYSPTGPICGQEAPQVGSTKRYEDLQETDIPDHQSTGVVRVIDVPESATALSVGLELNVTHSYPGDLSIVLQHGDLEEVVFEEGDNWSNGISQTFDVPTFADKDIAGRWTLLVVDSAEKDVGVVHSWALVFGVL